MLTYFVVVFAALLTALCVAGLLLLLSFFRVDVFDRVWFRSAVVLAAAVLIADVMLFGVPNRRARKRSTVSVTAVAHGSWWELRYATPYGPFTTANELHVPTSDDIDVRVVTGRAHLIVGPALRVGSPLRLHARSDTALFDVGPTHALRLPIVADASFDAWIRQQLEPAVAPATDAERAGRAVFATARCTFCHSVRGVAAAEVPQAPDLTHLGSRRTLAAGLLPNRPGFLAGWVVDAEGLEPGCGMPRNAMEPERLMALLAYLQRLR